MIERFSACLGVGALAFGLVFASGTGSGEPTHAIAMHGKPALAADFTHFPYANPDAPKGGTLRLAVTGSFDSLNPFIIKGNRAAGVRKLVFESLMARSLGEPFSLYGLIAEKVDMPDARDEVTFHLNPKARFSDGQPVTAEDVVFSWRTLRDAGRPNHRAYYKKVKRVETPDQYTVRFVLAGDDRELPLILALMPVLPAHVFKERAFDRTTLEPLIGSGPYVIKSVKPGQQVVFARNRDYWGRDLPASRGRWNFDEIRYDYFRDTLGGFEAFKKGLADFRFESDPTRWVTAYDFAAVKDGRVVRETIKTGLPAPASAFVFNTRRAVFADRRVRQALIMAFDFEWANRNLFHGLMVRTHGFFDGADLSSVGKPASARERRWLAEAGAKVDGDVLEGRYRAPKSDGSGRDRKLFRAALKLLAAAGWKIDGGVMKNRASGEALRFEMVVATREQEAIALNYQRSLRLIGVEMAIRSIDSAQFQRRLQTYDYDMIPFTWYNSLSPGNEQAFYWGSNGRDTPGTRNYMGVADPAIDAMIDKMLAARDRPSLVDAARAIDRILISGRYVLPLYHAPGQWLARWKRIARPETLSLYGFRDEVAWEAKP